MNKSANMLGLCMRAGRLVSGAQGVESAVKAGKAYLVLVDADASEETKKSVSDACRFRQIPLAVTERELLGSAIGRPGRMVAAVTDAPFANRIRQLLEEGI